MNVAAQGNEVRLRAIYSKVAAWDSPTDKAAVRRALQGAAGKGSLP